MVISVGPMCVFKPGQRIIYALGVYVVLDANERLNSLRREPFT